MTTQKRRLTQQETERMRAYLQKLYLQKKARERAQRIREARGQ